MTIRDGKDVVEWIEQHVDYKALNHATAEKAAVWWLADIWAEGLRDMNRREWIQTLIDGLKPLDLSAITDHLANLREDGIDVDTDTVESLTEFFKENLK
jgi:hypothetical protein